MNTDRNFFSGTSGLVLPGPKSSFPVAFRDKSRLAYYSVLFNSLEVNSSFYRDPKRSTLLRWIEEVQPGFRFTFKLPKTISHVKDLAFNEEDIHRFMDTIAIAGEHKGSILVQIPPGLNSERLPEMERLLESITGLNAQRWEVAIEFRHLSWYSKKIYRVLDRYNACMVLHDLPASAPPKVTLKAPFVYLRFHGPGGRYRGSYTGEFLQQHAAYINAQLDAGKTAYCYFNNTMGDAYNNLRSLNSFVIAGTEK